MTGPTPEPGCCNEYLCRRKNPIMLIRGWLTNSWYVVTDWKPRDKPWSFEAIHKHELDTSTVEQLNAAFDAQDKLAAAESALSTARARIAAIQAVVDEQAECDGLWFIPETITETYLMQELRRLHAVIEGSGK